MTRSFSGRSVITKKRQTPPPLDPYVPALMTLYRSGKRDWLGRTLRQEYITANRAVSDMVSLALYL